MPIPFGRAAMNSAFSECFTVYIMASGPRGVLYVGMSSDLPGRAWEHREGIIEGATALIDLSTLKIAMMRQSPHVASAA